MKKLFSNSAISLVELIIAIALVSIVLLGVFSVNMVLNTNNQDYGQKYLITSATQISLNHILNNAALAVGYGNPAQSTEGIQIGALGDASTSSLCIHQSSGNNLVGYNAGDIWLCYTYYPTNYVTASLQGQIYWCAEKYPAPPVGNDPRGATSCSIALAVNLIPNPSTNANTTYLGTAYNIAPVFIYNGGATTLLFSMTITNCLKNSAASCQASGTSNDPANNPEVQLTGSVIPPQESM